MRHFGEPARRDSDRSDPASRERAHASTFAIKAKGITPTALNAFVYTPPLPVIHEGIPHVGGVDFAACLEGTAEPQALLQAERTLGLLASANGHYTISMHAPQTGPRAEWQHRPKVCFLSNEGMKTTASICGRARMKPFLAPSRTPRPQESKGVGG